MIKASYEMWSYWLEAEKVVWSLRLDVNIMSLSSSQEVKRQGIKEVVHACVCYIRVALKVSIADCLDKLLSDFNDVLFPHW